MLSNEEIIKLLKLYGKLLELHEENPFKVKAVQSAVFQLDKIINPLANLSPSELASIPNVGKSIAQHIIHILSNRSFPELTNLLENTPPAVISMLSIKGLGAKKVRTLWQDFQIDNIQKLKAACIDGSITKVKGIGDNLRDEILEYIQFKEASAGKAHFAAVENLAFELKNKLSVLLKPYRVELVGDVPRMLEVVEKITFIVAVDSKDILESKLQNLDGLLVNKAISSPYIYRAYLPDTDVVIEIKATNDETFGNKVYLHNSSAKHLSLPINKASLAEGQTLNNILNNYRFANEQQVFNYIKSSFIPSECREGYFEHAVLNGASMPVLIEDIHIKGVLHNHTTYSDGSHTLLQMAEYAQQLGYEYLGVTDHSKTAQYAGGLLESKIIEQHNEIDALNKKLCPFKIFKGIESDILADGSLDYSDDVLASFDFIVASVHQNLKMDIEKATQRLIKAIENPYTTMLGHPTGRLLLRRQGYPLHMQKVIDACAQNGVIIEINANPWRLDLDWRWVHYATEKGVLISINPDAHEMQGYHDMHFGVCVARKAGLSPANTFNTWNVEKVDSYFSQRKSLYSK